MSCRQKNPDAKVGIGGGRLAVELVKETRYKKTRRDDRVINLAFYYISPLNFMKLKGILIPDIPTPDKMVMSLLLKSRKVRLAHRFN